MGILKAFKKKRVPDQLPDLATDQLEKGIKSEEKKEVGAKVDMPKKDGKETPLFKPLKEYSLQTSLEEKEAKSQEMPKGEGEAKEDIEESFFKELKENINKNLEDLDKFEGWYNKKVLCHDIVSDMKDYWQNQKPESIIKILGRDFKGRISEKIAELKECEKKWQNSYFDLIETEEGIREKERELKKLISEFVDLCKRRAIKKKKS